jgi:hypothetical protein
MSNFYTTLQYQEFVDDQENSMVKNEGAKVFAKSVKAGYSKDITNTNPKYNRYYVRIEANKKLYDPFPKYSVSDNRASFIDKVCKSNNSYKEVTESVFNMYLNYLRTENVQWYNKAQRELTNLA